LALAGWRFRVNLPGLRIWPAMIMRVTESAPFLG
jgi:hypothetical protein